MRIIQCMIPTINFYRLPDNEWFFCVLLNKMEILNSENQLWNNDPTLLVLFKFLEEDEKIFKAIKIPILLRMWIFQ